MHTPYFEIREDMQMSQSEDYLDGLLNSINKAKTDAKQVQEEAIKKQQQVVENRKAISPDEDFFTATGIDVQQAQTKKSHPYLRQVLSEEDFLRKFEEELENDDVDLFISNFEQEIDDEERIFQETGELPDSENVVNNLFNNIENAVKDETETKEEPIGSKEPDVDLEDKADSNNIENEDDDNSEGEDTEDIEAVDLDIENVEDPSGNDSDLTDEDTPLELPEEEIDLSSFIEEPEDAPIDASEDDDFGFSLDDATDDVVEEDPLDDSLKEFLPDEMDALDEVQFGDGEEPDLSGESDLELESIIEGGEDEDLLDIQSLLSGDEEGPGDSAEIDEAAEEAEPEDTDEKGKKKKKKKDKKEKGEKKPNPIVQKLLLILFGPPDEDEIAEEEAKKKAETEITYDEEGNPIVPEEGGKKKKKKEKKEKPPKEKKPKKEKPPKQPKPKKEKKPKEPDNSPKIPISIIATFLVLSISIIGVVMVGMTFTGIKRHMAQANELYEEGNYIAAYEKLNGFDLSDEKVALLRNQTRLLADLQLRQQEYEAFINYEKYNYALDSLIMGIGRYEKYKDEAAEYGVADEYDAYGNGFIAELLESFGLTEEQALEIYNQPNRQCYTIDLRKVLRSLGLPDL